MNNAGGGKMFVCGVPKSLAEFSAAFDAGESQFGQLSVSPSMAKEIFAFRPEVYLSIVAQNGVVAAYSSAYPLKPRWADALVAGDIAEPDLTPDMLLCRQDGLDGCHIYVGAIVVRSCYDPFSKSVFLANLLAWRAKQLQDASVKRITAIMTPVTKQGQRLVRYIGAERLGTGADVNGHAIYGRKLSPGFLYRITSSMEKLLSHSMVRLDEDFQPPLLPTLILSSPTTAHSLSLDYV
jgi:hypothetical protein